MNQLKVAVIGGGHLGRFHAKLLAAMPDVELVAVADPVAAARERVAAECQTEAVAKYHELIERVDAAIIATPTRLHHRVSLDFLRHGVHLLVEKPLAATLAEADEMVALARKNGAVLQAGHIERFNPALTVAAPYIREPKFIEATRASGYTFRSTDIGVVLDLMIHDLDVAMSLAGTAVVRVDALGLAVFGPHEDVAHARLEFAGGTIANLNASRVSHAGRRAMQVWSRQGFTSIDFTNRTATVVQPSAAVLEGRVDFAALAPEEQAALKDCVMTEHLPQTVLTAEASNALADEQRDFVDSIRSGRTPRVSGEDGRNVLAAADLILKKIETHRWEGGSGGSAGPHPLSEPSILRGPHWDRSARPVKRREAS